MPIVTEWVRYGGDIAFLARSERASTPLPSVVVIQEVWGVDAHIQDVARRIANAGYVAFAPDLYAVEGVRPDALRDERVSEVKAFMNALPPAAWMDAAQRDAALAKLPSPDRERIDESRQQLFGWVRRMAELVPRLLAATSYLRERCDLTRGRHVASIGFCMGGGLSALLACHDAELAGAAVFYGSSPPAERVAKIACPIIGFYGGLDQRINAGIPAFAEAMKEAGKSFEPNVYEGAPHAFFNDTRPSYHVEAARDAFAKLLTFLRATAGA